MYALYGQPERVTIHGIEYDIIASNNAAGLPRLRAEYDRYGIRDSVILRRPRGRKTYAAYRRTDGRIDRPHAAVS